FGPPGAGGFLLGGVGGEDGPAARGPLREQRAVMSVDDAAHRGDRPWTGRREQRDRLLSRPPRAQFPVLVGEVAGGAVGGGGQRAPRARPDRHLARIPRHRRGAPRRPALARPTRAAGPAPVPAATRTVPRSRR